VLSRVAGKIGWQRNAQALERVSRPSFELQEIFYEFHVVLSLPRKLCDLDIDAHVTTSAR